MGWIVHNKFKLVKLSDIFPSALVKLSDALQNPLLHKLQAVLS